MNSQQRVAQEHLWVRNILCQVIFSIWETDQAKKAHLDCQWNDHLCQRLKYSDFHPRINDCSPAATPDVSGE